MPTLALSNLPSAGAHSDALASLSPAMVKSELDSEERGRLKRRRTQSHSPRRASSPSRGHDRHSGSRYRQHHRKHHRPSSPASSVSPPTIMQKKYRRRSDAEPDHTFRGRVRNRSGSIGKDTVFEDDEFGVRSGEEARTRKRSQPPSRHRVDGAGKEGETRRQRSYPNLYQVERRDSKEEGQAPKPTDHVSQAVGHKTASA